MSRSRRLFRRLHRWLVPMAALPLGLTALSGALYGTVLELNLEESTFSAE